MPPFSPVAAKDRDPNLVFIGMPATGEPLFKLARTIASLEVCPNDLGLKFVFRKVGGQGVAKARNILTYMARCSGASRMIMVDSDMAAEPGHFFSLLSHKEPFVGALYPKKEIPLRWVGEFMKVEPKQAHPLGLWPMYSLGGGLLKIDLWMIDQMIDAYPERAYLSDDEAPVVGLMRNQVMYDLWGQGVVRDPWLEGKNEARYLTEDYYFAHLWRKIGGKCFVNPFCQVGHVGAADYLDFNSLLEAQKPDLTSPSPASTPPSAASEP